MNYLSLKEKIGEGEIDGLLKKVICDESIAKEKERYLSLLDDAYKLFGDGDYHFVSSPGRSEIGGNHTDHQHGHVLAASLNIDNLCVFKANNSNTVNFIDRDFKFDPVSLDDLSVYIENYNTSKSLIIGIANKLKELGYLYGGFDCLCESKVLVGSGISSSACFEVMIVEIFNCLFNDCKINPVDRAIIGQYAENVYFGKPSGLLDQMAISVGGFVAIDFKDINKPVINNYEFSFSDYGYELVLVNTKGNHSDLSHEYAAIPYEIKEVAHKLNVEYLADSSLDELFKNIKDVRECVKNDRAILRAIHFYNEDNRAIEERKAVENKDVNKLLNLIKESGRSSYEYLQNVYSNSNVSSQSISLALALADTYLNGSGAYRVHGGGFEGTVQCIVPADKLSGFEKLMNSVFGDDCLLKVRVRPFGTKTII